MLVLLYSVCRSVTVLSCVNVIHSFTYVLRVVFGRHKKTWELRERERKREGIITASRRYHKKTHTRTSGCGSFVVNYFQPATYIDRLHKNDYPFAGRGLVILQEGG